MESMGTGLGEIYGYPSRNNLPISFITYMHVNFAFVSYLKDDDEEEKKKKKTILAFPSQCLCAIMILIT